MGIDFCNDTERQNLIMLFGTKRDLDIKPLYTYLCPVIIFVCFFSIIFNSILISISRQSKVVNKSPILLLSLNLAATDLIASLLNGLSILFNSYLPEVYDIKMGQCSMLMFEVVRCGALVASALHLLALAFVHYRGIVNPLHYRSKIFFSQHLSRTINIISIVCWIIPLTIMISWFSSSPCQGFTFRYMVLTLFALPLLLMSIIYLRIFIIISRHQKGRRINHNRDSTLNYGVIRASSAIGSAAAVNLPELIAQTERAKCVACTVKGSYDDDDDDDDDPTISILSEETDDNDDYVGYDGQKNEIQSGGLNALEDEPTKNLINDCNKVESGKTVSESVSSWSQLSSSQGSSLRGTTANFNKLKDPIVCDGLGVPSLVASDTIATSSSKNLMEPPAGSIKADTIVNNEKESIKVIILREEKSKAIIREDTTTNHQCDIEYGKKDGKLEGQYNDGLTFSDKNPNLNAQLDQLSEQPIESKVVISKGSMVDKSNPLCLAKAGEGGKVEDCLLETARYKVYDDVDSSLRKIDPSLSKEVADTLDSHTLEAQSSREASRLDRSPRRRSNSNKTHVTKSKAPIRAQISLDVEVASNTEAQLLTLPSKSRFSKSTINKGDQLCQLRAGKARQQHSKQSSLGMGTHNSLPTRECTCDNKSRQFKVGLSRAHTIGENSSRPGRLINKTVITLTGSQRSSISSVVGPTSLKSHLRRSPTSASDTTRQVAYRSKSAGLNNCSVATTALSSSSTYEPQRRHIHASAVPQTSTKALVTTLLILGTYFISYVPAIIYQVLTCIDHCPYPLYDISFSRRVLLGAMTTLLLIAKSIIDPFIYSYRMNEIQIAISRYLSKRRSKSSMATSMYTSQRFQASSHHQFSTINVEQANNSPKIVNVNSKTNNSTSITAAPRPSNSSRVIHTNKDNSFQERRTGQGGVRILKSQEKKLDTHEMTTLGDGNKLFAKKTKDSEVTINCAQSSPELCNNNVTVLSDGQKQVVPDVDSICNGLGSTSTNNFIIT